ncbi:kinase-like domain-containing protein [Mycena rosella]|uniref:Kinase-like domain-containing protein n=1 Tax=Mycena rosella TaxID=1033263 RepID=A0AAD7D7Q1_MYCRO|nr:kinase-like domain-containing protein [Mycena rosella]
MPNPTVPCQYRTGKTLGTGTYYISKEAIHIETGKYYGCKIIRKTAMQGRGHLVRNEIAVLKRVKSDNPNIVKLHDYFETMHSVYLCLDLCTGGTLFDRIRDKGTYPEAKTADLVRTILIAVKHIHNSGIEHRDLNPKTLHFRSLAEGAPIMIADFGHGRLTEEIREGRDDGEMKLYGVHRYMAPEVFVKPNHSKPVDVWGVGLLAFFMIAGYTPFDRDRVQLETDAIVAGEYKFAPGEKWDNISVNAREFIGMCLTVDPDRRPTAKDALAHTWLVPPTPRVIQVKSRTASLLELRLPYFKKVFNPKRKWRIVVLTIKALNRMHTLAGHPLPSTQQDADEEATGQVVTVHLGFQPSIDPRFE